MMKVRLIMLTLVLVLTSIVNIASSETTTIRYLCAGEGEAGPLSEGGMVQEMVETFMDRNPDIKVELEWPVGSVDQKIVSESVAGDPADVMLIWHPWSHHLAGKQIFADLNPYIEIDKTDLDPDDYFPGVLDALSYKGSVYALPTWTTSSGLFYNQRLFDEAGILYPDDSWTWDTLVESGKKLTKQEDNKITQFGFTSDGWSLQWGTGPTIWVWSKGVLRG